MVGPTKTPAFWSVACPIRRRFRVFLGTVERLHAIKLPFPTLAGASPESKLSSFKSFCSAALERRSNIWSDSLQGQRVSSRTRMSIYHSLFLFRKLIPGEKPSCSTLFNKVTTAAHEPDPLFMDFIRREVPKLLPRGWDYRYAQNCLNATVPVKSCFERNHPLENSRSFLADFVDSEDGRQSFIESVLATYRFNGSLKARLQAVQSGGKWRVLSIPSVEMNYLRPLHTTLYDYLGRYKWLLRGEEKASRFKDFVCKEGELFVSGDYESATDNLNPYVQKEILRLLLQNTRHVPNEVRRLAFSSLSLNLLDPSDPNQMRFVEQQNGQMMGNLLSFPLLCLVNYLTFRFLIRDSNVPVKVNGDDIVFRARPEMAKRWMEGVQCSGLVLSKGKTLVDRRYFTLNSSLFQSGACKVLAIPFIRSKALFGLQSEELPYSSIGGRFRSFAPGYFGRRRVLLRAVFLRENSGWINQSCRSLCRGLGVPVQSGELKESGLWARELRYLELPSERKPPPTFSMWSQVPDGFELAWVDKGRKRSCAEEEQIKVAMLMAAWKVPAHVTAGEYKETWFGGLDLSDRVFLRKRHRFDQKAKLLKVSHAQVRSFLRLNPTLWETRPQLNYRLEWLPVDRPRALVGSCGSYPLSIPINKHRDLPNDDYETEDNMHGEAVLYPPPAVY
jgi:hypothetical protein